MIKCTLDEDGCIDLLTVLRVVNQIDQEQAWAICYQIGTVMQRLTTKNCAPIEDLGQILLHEDGFVHEKSCSVRLKPVEPDTITIPNQKEANTTTTPTIKTQVNQQPKQQQTPPTPPITPELNEILRRRPALDEKELVASLGIALFWALDYGIPNDEERKLNVTMEYMMIQALSAEISLDEILEICISRLPVATKLNADSHYSSICKSLVSDTIELSIFLEKIYTASMVLSDITLDKCLESNHKCDITDDDLSQLGEPLASLRALRINDWARLWMQVIRELRQRGRFKQALSVT